MLVIFSMRVCSQNSGDVDDVVALVIGVGYEIHVSINNYIHGIMEFMFHLHTFSIVISEEKKFSGPLDRIN